MTARRTPETDGGGARAPARRSTSTGRKPPDSRDRDPGPGRALAGSLLGMRGLQLGLVATAAFGVFANTLLNGFVDDDEAQVLRNAWIRDFRHLPEIFSQSVWSFLRGAAVSNYYRPLMHVVYLANFQVFGLRAWGFHLVNVLLHTANSLLVYLYLEKLLLRPSPGEPASTVGPVQWLSVPFAAALLFAVHPIHTEAVAWIASVPELGFTLFGLLALRLDLDAGAAGGRSRGRVLLTACFLFLALLFKETAVTLLLLLALVDAALPHPAPARAPRFRRHLLFLAVAAIYLSVRYHVLEGTLVPVRRLWDLNAAELVLSSLALFAEYLRSLALPLELNFWHSFEPVRSLATVRALVSLALASAFAIGGWAAWRRSRPAFLALAFILVPLAPAFYIRALSGKPFAERYLYFPSIGFALLVALFLRHLVSRTRARALAVAALLVVVALFATATVRRNRVWKSAFTLFSDTVRQSPDATIPRYDLAVALHNLGRIDEAIAHYRILVNADPDDVHFWSALGGALLAKGRTAEAVEQLQEALRIDPGSVESIHDLAVASRREGRVDEAMMLYRRALEIDPEFADAHFNLAGLLAEAGRFDEALSHYRSAVRSRPESAYYQTALAIELARRGLLAEALPHFEEAVRLSPEEPAYRKNLERARALQRPTPDSASPPSF